VSETEAQLYLYGVVPVGEQRPKELAGVGDPPGPVRAVEHGSLAALVSDLSEAQLLATRDVRAHWQMLERVVDSGTVVPARFGTTAADEGWVRESLLAGHERELEELLEALAGRVQLALKGRYDEEDMLREAVRSSPSVAKLREAVHGRPEQATYYARIRLGEAVAEAIEKQRTRDSRLALERLEPLAADTRVEAPGRPEMAFDLAFLVERARIDEFSAAVARLGEELGERVRLRYVGPQPPYSFAELDLTEAEPSWA
jgi:Gas vesicle synthesis protein GvpL/GvpF